MMKRKTIDNTTRDRQSKSKNYFKVTGKGLMTKDSYQNLIAKLGVGSENLLSSSTYSLAPFVSRLRVELEAMYRSSWLVGQVVDTVAEDMTREGITMNSKMSPKEIAKIQSTLVEYDVWHQIAQAIKWARLFGGSIVVILIDGIDYSKPLRYETIGKGRFKGLYVLDRWQIVPSLEELVTEIGKDLGKPKYYNTLPGISAFSAMKIHHTRVLRFDGIELPYYQKLAENMWGLSVIERMFDRLLAFDSATAGASQLLFKAHLRTIGVEGLREALATGGELESAVIKNFNYIRLLQSMEGLTILDAKDNFQTHTYSFSGISDLLQQFGQQISGSTEIPLVRLFGQSPAGFSATGESDLRNYYDSINKKQVSQLTNPIRVLLEVVSMSVNGKPLPDDFEFKFNPLWQMSDKEKVDIVQTGTSAIGNMYQSGIITKKIAMKELQSQSRVTGVFTNITDEDIENAVEEPPPHAGGGMMGGEEGGEMPPKPKAQNPVGSEKDQRGEKSLEQIEEELRNIGEELRNIGVETKGKSIKQIEEELKAIKLGKEKTLQGLENELDNISVGKEKTLEDLQKELDEISISKKSDDLDELQQELNNINLDRVMPRKMSIVDRAINFVKKKIFRFKDDNEEFKEKEHPRAPAGTEKGGQFVKKGSGVSSSQSSKKKDEEKKEEPKPKKEKPPIKEKPYPKITAREEGFVDTKRLPPTKVLNKKGAEVVKAGELRLADGSPLPEHVAHVPIPPNWQHVRINPDPNGDLLVMGTDQKGNRQPIYSKAHDERVSKEKFDRIKVLESKSEKIIQRIINECKGTNKETALCLRLIEQEGVRADSEKDAGEVKIYGATTIQNRHIKVKPDGVFLEFIGKHGVKNRYKVKDPLLVEEFIARANRPDKKQRVFDTNYSKLRLFTHEITDGENTPKDFRTRVAVNLAKKVIREVEKMPTTEKEYKKATFFVGDVVSKQLCNTRSVCLQKYIDPELFKPWRENVEKMKEKANAKDSIQARCERCGKVVDPSNAYSQKEWMRFGANKVKAITYYCEGCHKLLKEVGRGEYSALEERKDREF